MSLEMTSTEMDLMNEQGKSILIIEDEKDIRETLQSILENEGFDAFTAKNGQDALSTLEKIPKPSLILLDLMMPVMDGYEFVKKLTEDELYSTIPIIIVTASKGKIEMKCKEIIKKPFDLDQMLPLIKHHFFRGVFSETEDVDYTSN